MPASSSNSSIHKFKHDSLLGRKGDGHPGPKALWEGLLQLHAFAIGIATAKQAFIPPG